MKTQIDPFYVDFHHPIEVLFRGCHCRPNVGNSGVIYKNIRLTERSLTRMQSSCNRIGATYVALDKNSLAASRFNSSHGFICGILIEIKNSN